MTVINARGYSCPQPVMMALKAMTETEGAFTVETDHETAAENVERAVLEKGRGARIVKNDGGYSVEVAAK